MATEIASLYASIGANTSELQKALSQASRLLGDASRQFETAGRASDQFDRHTKSTGLNLGSLKTQFIAITAGVVAFGAAMKKVYDTAREGATIEQTRQSFDRLGVSLDSLRDASRGTIDDMGLMSGALTLVAGASGELQSKLLGAAPQLLEIAKAANALNPTLGDTAFMYQSIATGIKRSSPLILDNLGIIVKIGEANERYAATLGKTVEAMTAEEKQIALLNATIEAGGRLIEQAGGSAASAGDAFAQLGTYTKNAAADFKVFVYEAVEPAVRWLADLLNKAQELMRMQREAGAGALADPDISWETYARNQMSAAQEAGEFARMVESNVVGALRAQGYNTTEIIGLTKDYNTTVQTAIRLGLGWGDVMSRQEFEFRRMAKSSMDVGVGMAAFPRTYEQAAKAADNYRSSLFALGATSKTVGSAYENEIQRLGQLAQERRAAMAEAEAQALVQQQYSRLQLAISGPIRQANEQYEEQQKSVTERTAELEAELAKLEAGHGRMVTVQNRSALSAAELNLATLQLADAQAKLSEETDPLKAGQLAVKIEDLQGKIDGATGATTRFVDNSTRIQEIKDALDDLKQQYDDNAKAHEEATKRILFNLLEQRLAVDGTSEDEFMMLQNLAGAWGLLDEKTLAYITDYDAWIKAMEDGGPGWEDFLAHVLASADGVGNLYQNLQSLPAEVRTKVIVEMIEERREMATKTYTPEMYGPEYWAGGTFIPPTNTGMHAEGGFIPVGSYGTTGERGPEMFNVTRAGVQVTPLSGGRNAGGDTVYNTYNITGYSPREIADEIERRQAARGIRTGRYSR